MTSTTPSLEALQRIVETHTATAFVWPHETVMPDGIPERDVERRIQAGEVQPLLVDPTTAQLLLSVYRAANATTQSLIRTRIQEDRAEFARVVEIAWKCVHRGATHD